VFNKTIVIVEIVSANKAIVIDRAIAVDRVNMADEANEASLAKVNELLANGGIAVVIKYSSKLLTCSHSPSQNISNFLLRWRDILV
jgi:hypothetical protein